MKQIAKIANHLKNYLLWYALTAIAIGWTLGILFPNFVASNQKILNSLITVFVFLMIYPMMTNLDLLKIPAALKNPKPYILAIVYNFVITPLLGILFLKFIPNPDLALGFMLILSIPGSSMCLGYTGLVKGNMEVATIAMAISFILVPILLPFYIGFVGKAYHINIPLGFLLQTLVVALIVPMLVGDLTRRGIIKFGGKKLNDDLKPLFSLTTMVMLLFLIALLFLLKAQILLAKWKLVVYIALLAPVYFIILIPLVTYFNKLFGLGYRDHMGITFLSIDKNNGLAVGIATLAFSPLSAIAAVIFSLFQIIFSLIYVSMEKTIRAYFLKYKWLELFRSKPHAKKAEQEEE